MDFQKGDMDELVQIGFDKGTVKSYFTIESLKEFIGNKADIIEFKVIHWTDDENMEYWRRAHLVIQR